MEKEKEVKERVKFASWDRPTVKQRKFICPKCGDYRMLNKGVTLSLCHKCDYIQMVPESELLKLNKSIGGIPDKSQWRLDGIRNGNSSQQQRQ